MEKIQKAIAKARAERSETSDRASPARADDAAAGSVASDTGSAAVSEAWNQLKSFSPNNKRLKRARVLTLSGGPEASTFDVLRTKTLQTMRANNWRRLAITSPTPACGKSTITLNMAFSLARQSDTRTIVAEIDMRRPSLAKTLGVAPAEGFARVLEGKVNFADQAVRSGDNLAFGLNSGPVRNPAELLHGAGVSEHLSAIESRYQPDLMIFDMPPMLVSDDMMAFSGHVDCVLLVAAAEATSIKEIDNCERELASQTNFMGVLLNKCRYKADEYGYGYYGYG